MEQNTELTQLLDVETLFLKNSDPEHTSLQAFAAQSVKDQKEFLEKQKPSNIVAIVNHIYLAGYTLDTSICRIYGEAFIQQDISCLTPGDINMAKMVFFDNKGLLTEFGEKLKGLNLNPCLLELFNAAIPSDTTITACEYREINKHNAPKVIQDIRCHISFWCYRETPDQENRPYFLTQNVRKYMFASYEMYTKPLFYVAPKYMRYFLLALNYNAESITYQNIWLAHHLLSESYFLAMLERWLAKTDLDPKLVILIINLLHAKKYQLTDKDKEKYCNALQALPDTEIAAERLILASQIIPSEKNVLSEMAEKYIPKCGKRRPELAIKLINALHDHDIPLSDATKQWYAQQQLPTTFVRNTNHSGIAQYHNVKLDLGKAKAIIGQQWFDNIMRTYTASLNTYISQLDISREDGKECVDRLLNDDNIYDPDNGKKPAIETLINTRLEALIAAKNFKDAVQLILDIQKTWATKCKLLTLVEVFEKCFYKALSEQEFVLAFDMVRRYVQKEFRSTWAIEIRNKFTEYAMTKTSIFSQDQIISVTESCIKGIDEFFANDEDKKEELKHSVKAASEHLYEKLIAQVCQDFQGKTGSDEFHKQRQGIIERYKPGHLEAEVFLFEAKFSMGYFDYHTAYECFNTVALKNPDKQFPRSCVDDARLQIAEGIIAGHFKPCIKHGAFRMEMVSHLPEQQADDTPVSGQEVETKIAVLEYLFNNTHPRAKELLSHFITLANGGAFGEVGKSLTPEAQRKYDNWLAIKYNRTSKEAFQEIAGLKKTVGELTQTVSELKQLFITQQAEMLKQMQQLLAMQQQLNKASAPADQASSDDASSHRSASPRMF